MASGYSAYEVFEVTSANVSEPYLTSKLSFFTFAPSLQRQPRPLYLQAKQGVQVNTTSPEVHSGLHKEAVTFSLARNVAYAKVSIPLLKKHTNRAVQSSFSLTTQQPEFIQLSQKTSSFSQTGELLQAEAYIVKGCNVQDRSIAHSKLTSVASTFVKDIHLTELNADKCIIKTTGNEKLPHIKVYAPLGFNGKVLEFEEAITHIANQPFFVRFENNQLYANVCFDGEFSMFVYLTNGNIVRVTITSSVEEFLSESLPKL